MTCCKIPNIDLERYFILTTQRRRLVVWLALSYASLTLCNEVSSGQSRRTVHRGRLTTRQKACLTARKLGIVKDVRKNVFLHFSIQSFDAFVYRLNLLGGTEESIEDLLIFNNVWVYI